MSSKVEPVFPPPPIEITDFVRATLRPDLPGGSEVHSDGPSKAYPDWVAKIGIPVMVSRGGIPYWGHKPKLVKYHFAWDSYYQWVMARIEELGLCRRCQGHGALFQDGPPEHYIACPECVAHPGKAVAP